MQEMLTLASVTHLFIISGDIRVQVESVQKVAGIENPAVATPADGGGSV